MENGWRRNELRSTEMHGYEWNKEGNARMGQMMLQTGIRRKKYLQVEFKDKHYLSSIQRECVLLVEFKENMSY